MLQITLVKNITVKGRCEQTKDGEGWLLGLVWLHVRPCLPASPWLLAAFLHVASHPWCAGSSSLPNSVPKATVSLWPSAKATEFHPQQ